MFYIFGVAKAIFMNIKTVFLIGLFAITIKFANAQGTSIVITSPNQSDSSGTIYCNPPVNLLFNISVIPNGYIGTDLLTLYADFGDGYHDTHIIPQQYFFYLDTISHRYQSPGIYTLTFIISGPDGKADTVTQYNHVIISANCGNVTGKLFFDNDADCVCDNNEIPLTNIPVTANYEGHKVASTLSDSSGVYSLTLSGGLVYEIFVGGNNPYYPGNGLDMTCPNLGYYLITTVPSSGYDFGVSCESGFDLEANLSGWRFRPGDTALIRPFALNNHCLPVDGKYKVILDPLLTFVNATNPPDLISGDTLIWNFTNLDNSCFLSPMNNVIRAVTSTSAVLGDSICLKMIIEPVAGDENPSNNIFNGCYEIRNSWDPNIKEVFPRGQGVAHAIAPQAELTYTIHFQNTGTAAAYDISIQDTLDSDLDISTFEVVAYSHPLVANILPGNILEFYFADIMLPDSTTNEPESHGCVVYRIKPKNTLADGTEITNKAGIYFDYNSAIITNTTLNTISTLLGVNEINSTSENNIQIFPVPVDNILTINAKDFNKIEKIEIINYCGKLVYSSLTFGRNSIVLNTSEMPSGLYLVRAYYKDVIHTSKLIVIH
jgi:uncharacterized repeat protein (TIGR01451 family)